MPGDKYSENISGKTSEGRALGLMNLLVLVFCTVKIGGVGLRVAKALADDVAATKEIAIDN